MQTPHTKPPKLKLPVDNTVSFTTSRVVRVGPNRGEHIITHHQLACTAEFSCATHRPIIMGVYFIRVVDNADLCYFARWNGHQWVSITRNEHPLKLGERHVWVGLAHEYQHVA